MDRRLFIRSLGVFTGSIFIPDSFLLKVERFWERGEGPLLKSYRNPAAIFLVNREFGDLHLGDPNFAPPTPTWREFLNEKQGYDLTRTSADNLEFEWGITPDEIDKEMEREWFLDWFCLHDSSGAKAYHFLEPLDVGPIKNPGGEVVGELRLLDRPSIGSSSRLPQIDNAFSLPFLQYRLERLGHSCNFKFYG